MKTLRTVIMAKAPVAGTVKTRLIPALGAQGAADLALHMLRHTLGTASAAQLGPIELCMSPASSDACWQQFGIPQGIICSDQGDGDLGQRMARIAQRTIARGEALLLIGTDCPALSADTLRHAASALTHNDASMVPTWDGGYCLLGLRAFDASLFTDICWSTDTVAATTLDRMAQLDWQVEKLPMMHDIDEPSDLQWLPSAWNGAATLV
jgi:uncharacterized protein